MQLKLTFMHNVMISWFWKRFHEKKGEEKKTEHEPIAAQLFFTFGAFLSTWFNADNRNDFHLNQCLSISTNGSITFWQCNFLILISSCYLITRFHLIIFCSTTQLLFFCWYIEDVLIFFFSLSLCLPHPLNQMALFVWTLSTDLLKGNPIRKY